MESGWPKTRNPGETNSFPGIWIVPRWDFLAGMERWCMVRGPLGGLCFNIFHIGYMDLHRGKADDDNSGDPTKEQRACKIHDHANEGTRGQDRWQIWHLCASTLNHPTGMNHDHAKPLIGSVARCFLAVVIPCFIPYQNRVLQTIIAGEAQWSRGDHSKHGLAYICCSFGMERATHHPEFFFNTTLYPDDPKCFCMVLLHLGTPFPPKETSRSRRVGISFDDLGQGDARQGRPGLLEGQGLWPAPWKRMGWWRWMGGQNGIFFWGYNINH